MIANYAPWLTIYVTPRTPPPPPPPSTKKRSNELIEV